MLALPHFQIDLTHLAPITHEGFGHKHGGANKQHHQSQPRKTPTRTTARPSPQSPLTLRGYPWPQRTWGTSRDPRLGYLPRSRARAVSPEVPQVTVPYGPRGTAGPGAHRIPPSPHPWGFGRIPPFGIPQVPQDAHQVWIPTRPRRPAGPYSRSPRNPSSAAGRRPGPRGGGRPPLPLCPPKAPYQESESSAHRQPSSSVSAVPLRSLIASSPAGAAACPGRGAASAAPGAPAEESGKRGAESGSRAGRTARTQRPRRARRAGGAGRGRAGPRGAGPKGGAEGRGGSEPMAPPCGGMRDYRGRGECEY